MPEDPDPRRQDSSGDRSARPDEVLADGHLADEDVRDELPEDLDPTAFVGPYVFPNNSRRRVPGVLYLLIAALLVAVWFLAGDSPLVNAGFLLAAALLTLVGLYSLVSGWDLKVDETDALVAATAEVGFAVGHASAQMGWRGLLSRPTWRILLYSAENPPTRRGLVMVDGVDARIVGQIVEDNPEDWSELDGDLTVGEMAGDLARPARPGVDILGDQRGEGGLGRQPGTNGSLRPGEDHSAN